jgi:energy-coupling factor transport system permease protein
VAIARAGILATATSDPTVMADALVQQARVSPRYAIGVLAALRLLPLLAQEWQTIGMARRARGVEAGRSPVAALRLALGRLMALLVGTIRRASRMALAMEARGFGAMPCRTAARPRRMRAGDWGLMIGAVVLASAAIWISVSLGTWRPLLG